MKVKVIKISKERAEKIFAKLLIEGKIPLGRGHRGSIAMKSLKSFLSNDALDGHLLSFHTSKRS